MDWICFRCGKVFDSYDELSEHKKECNDYVDSLENYRKLTGDSE